MKEILNIDELYDEYIHKTEFVRKKFIPKFIKEIWLDFYDINIIHRVGYKLLYEGIYIWELKWLIHYYKNERNGQIRFMNNEECRYIECELSESTMNGSTAHNLHISCFNNLYNTVLKFGIDIYTKRDNSIEVRLSAIDFKCNKYTTIKKFGDNNIKLLGSDINTLTVANKQHYLSIDVYHIIEMIILRLIMGDKEILREERTIIT